MEQEFLEQSAYYMALNLPRIKNCLEHLNENEVWQRPNAASNSVGNLILHLCGNISQYILSGLGKQTDQRQRDVEFSTTDGVSKSELFQRLEAVVEQAIEIIKKTDRQTLLEQKTVQGFHLSGFGIIIHVVEHFSYHTGQIAFWVKLLKNNDLGFYKDIDLNITNA